MLDVSNELIDREVEQLRTTAGRAQSILWWQLFATVPVGLLLAVAVTVLVARPIRQLDASIRTLGDGVFETVALKKAAPKRLTAHLARLRDGAGVLDDRPVGLVAVREADRVAGHSYVTSGRERLRPQELRERCLGHDAACAAVC